MATSRTSKPAAHNDKPLGNIRRVNVAEETNQDPAMYPLKNGRLVVFPDVYDLPIDEAEKFFDELGRARMTGKITPCLKKWLSKEDFEDLVEEYPTLRRITPVFEAVMAHYEGVWGDPGEDDASES